MNASLFKISTTNMADYNQSRKMCLKSFFIFTANKRMYPIGKAAMTSGMNHVLR